MPIKLKLLIEIPCVAHLKVQVLNFKMIRRKFGEIGKGSFTEKAKIIG